MKDTVRRFPTLWLRAAAMIGAACQPLCSLATEVDVVAVPGAAAGEEAAFSADIDGTRMVIGMPGTGAGSGAAVIFNCATLPCAQEQRLLPPGGTSGGEFGSSVALSGDVVAVGAPQQGRVIVFRRQGTVWSEESTLAPASGAADHFGSALSLSGGRLAVSAPRSNAASGRVDVYINAGAAWSLEQSLPMAVAGARFGTSVALDGTSLLAGAPFIAGVEAGSYAQGAVYAYVNNGSGWVAQATLRATTPADGDLFGFSVALDADRALVGAPRRAAERGSAFVFERSAAVWQQTAELISATNALAGDAAGWSVALAGTRALVGAPYASVDPGGACGRAQVFDLNGPSWAANDFGLAQQAQGSELLGWSVAMSAQRVVAGAPGRAAGLVAHAGAAYLYDPDLRLFVGGFETPTHPCAIAN